MKNKTILNALMIVIITTIVGMLICGIILATQGNYKVLILTPAAIIYAVIRIKMTNPFNHLTTNNKH